MKIKLILTLHLLILSKLYAQDNPNFYTGEWKSYLTDNSTFDYLRLNKDGTGFKAIGKTINGKDTILKENHSFLQIIHWKVKNSELILKFKHDLLYDLNGTYIIEKINDQNITLLGDHFKLGVYPSYLNKETFKRTLTFTNSKSININDYGLKSDTCIIDIPIIKFDKNNDVIQMAFYKGFNDLIPHILGCVQEFVYVKNYYDPPYQINLPSNFNFWDFGFGDNLFYISFQSNKDSLTETSIEIYYDFKDSSKNHFFSTLKSGKVEKNLIPYNGKDLYLFKNWEGKHSGQIFYNNHIFIAYYTKDKLKEEILRKCISSFKYKN